MRLARLEEKLANMESENQVLRQQTLVLSPTKGLSNRFKSTVFQRSPENGYVANGEHREARGVPVSGDLNYRSYTFFYLVTLLVDLLILCSIRNWEQCWSQLEVSSLTRLLEVAMR